MGEVLLSDHTVWYIGGYLPTWNRCIGTNELPVHRYLRMSLLYRLTYRTAHFLLQTCTDTLVSGFWSGHLFQFPSMMIILIVLSYSHSISLSQPRLGQSNRCVENFSRVRLIGIVSCSYCSLTLYTLTFVSYVPYT